MKSQFAFASCQPGSEGFLKNEVEERIDGWKFAFSRPGFVTFKLPKEAAVDRFEPPRLTFARTVGLSFGKQAFPIDEITGETNYEAIADWFFSHELVKSLSADRTPAWHLWQRDSLLPGDGGFEPGATDATRTLQTLLDKRFAERKQASIAARAAEAEAQSDETSEDEANTEEPIAEQPKAHAKRTGPKRRPIAIDAIFVEPNECWIGAHSVRSRSDRWPGGVPQLEMPKTAVSRAYLKMQEALRWAALPTRQGDEWIELGCAPGGASQALLDNGMFVSGIDPAEVDPLLFTYERFRHLRMRTAETPRSELVGAQWLAADVNAAPTYTLEAIEAIVKHEPIRIRGMLITLKLLSPQLAAPEKITEVIAKLRSWGYGDVRVRQLAHNRREYCVAAMKTRGQRRMSR